MVKFCRRAHRDELRRLRGQLVLPGHDLLGAGYPVQRRGRVRIREAEGPGEASTVPRPTGYDDDSADLDTSANVRAVLPDRTGQHLLAVDSVGPRVVAIYRVLIQAVLRVN